MKSLQETTKIYTELNTLILGQYPLKDRPKVKGDYYLTKNGKLSDFAFKDFWEKIINTANEIRGDVLLFETPNKIPLFNILLDLLNDNVVLLENEQNQYARYICDHSSQLLDWLKSRLPTLIKPEIKDEVKAEYYEELKKYFTPEEQFKNYVFGKEFTQINFIGTQAQLAGIFKQINDNTDLIKQSWEQVTDFVYQFIKVKNKEINKKMFYAYLTAKKPIAEKNQIEIKI